ncbi:acetyl-CoA carboxylase [Sphaerisporangium siamense]|uniref:Acetyl-CoA carboxylase carboxyl transferase subunit beta n=1 Tax=Sphaerisporangium siamense TaxID=795645 RepID=A0A7W7D9Q8_9ACTN|nr:carboxyl transferase domain-containing protein [Sphaerisporangium siamense]MBB4702852.1 acetyl-CoA carboxylase carboxyl transferase subunit beta [Sphaerisporangium siamense]GII83391.1 acetyl-CoA carboxylase [Sphaerisporangium siamense]
MTTPDGAAPKRPDARTLIDTVLDPGSWKSWDEPPRDPVSPGSSYADELAAARARSGYDESVVTGEGLLEGRRVAVMACEFSFLAGSIGVVAAERLVRAVERATAERLPLLAAPASGGTRMQEGALAFVQMIKIGAAVAGHRAAGLPYIVYLRHPTTGGVFASWGSLGHVTAAEPGALIGFLGPRVFESLYGYPFPEGVQVSENLFRHGLVDAVVSAEHARAIAARALAVLCAPTRGLERGPEPVERPVEVEAWEAISRSRRDDRPSVRALLKLGASDVTPLNGTGVGENDPGLLLALARFGAAPAVVLGQDRRRQRTGRQLGPAGLRVARRGMHLAAELGLPLVTVIDTAGAELSKASEEGGLAAEIARCLADLVALDAPTVCLLLGEGAGGAALALLPADRVLCAQHGWLSPLPPEGASAILYRTIDFAPEIAKAQGVRAADLQRDGIVDRIIPEFPDAAYEPRPFCERVARTLEYEIIGLLDRPAGDRLSARLARYRGLGLRPD